jgi:hypothetical protein
MDHLRQFEIIKVRKPAASRQWPMQDLHPRAAAPPFVDKQLVLFL